MTRFHQLAYNLLQTSDAIFMERKEYLKNQLKYTEGRVALIIKAQTEFCQEEKDNFELMLQYYKIFTEVGIRRYGENEDDDTNNVNIEYDFTIPLTNERVSKIAKELFAISKREFGRCLTLTAKLLNEKRAIINVINRAQSEEGKEFLETEERLLKITQTEYAIWEEVWRKRYV